MSTTLDLLRQALSLHHQTRRDQARARRQKINLEARNFTGRPERVGEAETMILINGQPKAPSAM